MEKLTFTQKRILRFYLRHQARNLTVFSLFAYNWKIYIGFFGCAVLALALTREIPIVCYLFGALFAGFFIRDLRGFHATAKSWPLVREIIDWEKANKIAQKFDVEK